MIFGFSSILAGYLLGATPSAYIISYLCKKIDIRTVDNGNMGAGNVLRTVGILPGILVAFIDISKGYLAVFIASVLTINHYFIYATGFAALLGHCFPFWLDYKGGQGVAPVIGIFLFISPLAALSTLIIIFIALCIQYRSFLHRLFISILFASPTLPLFIYLYTGNVQDVIFAVIIIIFIIIRNVKKIIDIKSLLAAQKTS